MRDLAVGEAITCNHLFTDSGELVEQDMQQVAVRLQTRMCRMAEENASLVGLEIDLSDLAFQQSDCCSVDLPERINRRVRGYTAPEVFQFMRVHAAFWTGQRFYYPSRYCLWLKDQALSLHRAIINRLGPHTALTVSPHWITARDAIEFAMKFDIYLSYPQLNKHAERQLFDSRSQGNKRYVRLDSFVSYLWARMPSLHADSSAEEQLTKRIDQAKSQKGKPNLD